MSLAKYIGGAKKKEQISKHHSFIVDILDKFETLEKTQKKDVAKKLI